jgi:hypothetical protein
MANKKARSTEDFVRKMLTEVFKQKADSETVRSVAEKVSQAIADTPHKQDPKPRKAA